MTLVIVWPFKEDNCTCTFSINDKNVFDAHDGNCCNIYWQGQ